MNEEASAGFGDYLALINRRRAWLLTIVPAALLLSVFVAYALPAQYRSTATIVLEQSSIPQEFIQTTVASYADQQIEVISGRVMTPETLKGLVQEYDPYPELSNLDVGQKAQRVLANMSLERVDPVTLEPLEKSTAFSLHYQNPNPKRAAIVAQRLADLFLTYHQRQRTLAAREAAKLIQDRADSLTKELHQLDDEYAQLRLRHGDALPDSKERNEAARDRADRYVEELQGQLRAAQERESLLTIQLNGISPNLLTNKGDLTDLATVKAQLADAEQRYTPDHPDVKRLRRALASLLAQQPAQGAGATAVNADNPEYRRIAGELASARKEVAALNASIAKANRELDQYTGFLRSSPEIEREYADLQRRRESLQTEFQQIQGKLKGAQMGQQFEAEKQGEHFSLIRVPFAASSPFYPNRMGIILLGLVLGGAIAAVAVALAESSDATVRDARDLGVAGQGALLGGIPEILRPDDHRHRRMVWGSVCAVYLMAAIVVAVTVVQAHVHANNMQSSSSS